MSNITLFKKHIASRKAKPIGIQLKESKIELPYQYDEAELQFNKARATGKCSLQEGTVTAVDLEGDRQWIRLSFNNEFKDNAFLTWLNNTADTLIQELPEHDKDNKIARETLLLSRFRKDYTKKEKVPIRLWKMDRTGTLQPYEGCVTVGAIVICSVDEIRAYHKNTTNVVAELNRDIVIVRKSNKRRRIIQYFSDGED